MVLNRSEQWFDNGWCCAVTSQLVTRRDKWSQALVVAASGKGSDGIDLDVGRGIEPMYAAWGIDECVERRQRLTFRLRLGSHPVFVHEVRERD